MESKQKEYEAIIKDSRRNKIKGGEKMILKKIIVFLVLNFLFFGTNFLHGRHWVNLKNIGSKFTVVIEDLHEDAEKIGLIRNRLKTVAELRLRREGITIIDNLKSDLETPAVYINVNVVGKAFNVELAIDEWVHLKRIPVAQGCFAVVWDFSITGTHADDGEYIVSAINRLFDNFFNDYYKANPKKKEMNHGNL